MNEHKAFSYDCRNMKANEELSGTLQAKNEGGFSLNFINPVCVQNTGQGWWNQGDVAQTLRTPCGGDSIKANLIVYDACQHHGWRENDRVGTLTTNNNSTVRGDTPLICHRTVGGAHNWTTLQLIRQQSASETDNSTKQIWVGCQVL